MKATQYDYIFLGAGCSSLSIVMRMIESKKFSEKKILLIDKESKSNNDRTWCFWERDTGFFEEIVFRQWEHLMFKTGNEDIDLSITPYTYKMIRGIDFYQHCFSRIKSQENIDIIHGTLSFRSETQGEIKINEEPVELKKKTLVFNSILKKPAHQKDKFYLLQHFKGWIIHTSQAQFDPNRAVLMDFSVSQKHGTSFVYVMPLSSSHALIEYTLFTENVLPPEQYDKELKEYIRIFLKISDYTITEEEFGIIPMTNAISPKDEDGFYHIGTAGGQTKASTGYTFRFIQKQADLVVEQLIAGKSKLHINKLQRRFYFYDSTLLNILSNKLLDGKTIFSTLFKKNRAATVLKFLDNETSISEEIGLLNSLPKKTFLKAGYKEFIKMLF